MAFNPPDSNSTVMINALGVLQSPTASVFKTANNIADSVIVSTMREDVNTLQTDVGALQQNVSTINGKVTTLQNQTRNLTATATASNFTGSLTVNNIEVLCSYENNYNNTLSSIETGNSVYIYDTNTGTVKTLKEIIYFYVFSPNYAQSISAGGTITRTVNQRISNITKIECIGEYRHDDYPSGVDNTYYSSPDMSVKVTTDTLTPNESTISISNKLASGSINRVFVTIHAAF